MAKITIFDLGKEGLFGNLDVKEFRIPPNGFTNLSNFRFDGDRARGMPGNVYLTGIESPYVPRWVEFVQQPLKTWIVYSDLETLRAYDGLLDAEITNVGGDYAVPEGSLWDYTMFEGIPIFNPTNGTPQIWAPISGTQACIDLPNFPANTSAEIIRGYRNRLLAFNLTESGVNFPTKILSSHTATPGTLPSSWDVSDPTKDTVEFSTNAPRDSGILNASELSGSMYVYTNFTIHRISFRGGGLIFDNVEVLTEAGLFARRSLATLPTTEGPRHFYRGERDCYLFDGRRAVPILENQFRKSLNAAINPENIDKVFSVTYPKFNEVWLCYPEPGAALPTRALVYNYRAQSIGLRDLAPTGTEAIAAGRLKLTEGNTGIPFSDGAFFSDGFGFDGSESTAERLDKTGLIEAVPGESKLYLDNEGALLYGNALTEHFLERDGLTYSEINRVGELVSEFEKRLLWGRVWPRIGTGNVLIEFGSKEDEDGPITWKAPQLFNTDDKYIDPPGPVSGRILCIRFSAIPGGNFDISGYAYNVRVLGI
jgi:hypothetical protein